MGGWKVCQISVVNYNYPSSMVVSQGRAEMTSSSCYHDNLFPRHMHPLEIILKHPLSFWITIRWEIALL